MVTVQFPLKRVVDSRETDETFRIDFHSRNFINFVTHLQSLHSVHCYIQTGNRNFNFLVGNCCLINALCEVEYDFVPLSRLHINSLDVSGIRHFKGRRKVDFLKVRLCELSFPAFPMEELEFRARNCEL